MAGREGGDGGGRQRAGMVLGVRVRGKRRWGRRGEHARKKGIRRERKDRARDLKRKRKDQNGRWRDLVAKREKRERVAARGRGWERKKAGETLGFGG